MATSSATKISQLYVSLFGRAPDSAGLAFWTEALDGGSWTFASIAKSMFDTAPARAYYPAGATAEAVVTTFYTNVLGRAPDAEGLAFWVKEYTAAGKDQGAFFAKLITNVVDYTGTDAAGLKSKNLFANKVTVAEFYGNNGGSIAGATAALTGVTEVASTVDTAKTAILNPVVAGQTFTLTTGTAGDNIVGTSGNDTFSATQSTYQSADVILDSSSKDNDTLTLTTNSDITATPTVIGVENLNINFSGFTASGNGAGASTTLEIDLDNVGATKVTLQTAGSTAVNAATIDGLATGSSVTTASTFKTVGLTGVDNNASISVTTTATSATATSNLDVTSAGALEGLTVTETTGHLDVDVTAGDLDGTITITGAKNVDVNADTADIAVITSGKDLTITSLAAATSITLVATEDITGDADLATTVNIKAGATITAMSLDAATEVTISGAGIDTSAVAGGSDKSSVITADLLETLNVSGNGAAFDLDIQDASNTLETINVSGSQDVTIQADASLIDSVTKLTMTNSGTGKATLVLNGVTDAAIDISGVSATNNIYIAGTQDGGTDTIKVANGSTLTVLAAQTTLELTESSTTAATNSLTVVVDKPNASATTVAIADLTVTNVKTLNLDLTKDAADTTLGTVDIGATNNIAIALGANKLTSITDIVANTATFTGSAEITLADLSINELDASGMTGKVTYTAADGDVIRTGSGADVITIPDNTNAGIDVSISTGSGSDSVVFNAGDDYSNNTVVVDLGDGSLDSITVGAGAVISGTTVSITGVDKVTFSGDATVNDVLLDGSSAAVFGGTDSDVTITLTKATNDFSGLSIDTATVSTGDGDSFIISAASRTSAVTITGTDANDFITGSNGTNTWVADTLNGGEGNDTIYVTEGGDAVTGGDGTDTIDFTVIDNAFSTIEGSLTTATGLFVNLSTSAVSKSSIATNLSGSNISGGLTEAAKGTFGYLYATESSSAPSTVGTVATVENVTGSTGADYIVGSSSANTISAGAGGDFIVGGAGVDNIATGDTDTAADTVVYSANTDGGLTVITLTNVGTAADDFDAVAGTNVDYITEFETTVDKISIRGALRTALNGTNDATNGTDNTAVLLADNDNIDADTATVFILNTADDLAGDIWGDVSAIAAAWNTTNSGTPANWNANEEVLFAVGNDAGTAYGLYYFKDVNGNGDIGAGDQIALVAVIASATLAAADFVFAA